MKISSPAEGELRRRVTHPRETWPWLPSLGARDSRWVVGRRLVPGATKRCVGYVWQVLTDRLGLTPDELHHLSGWEIKPEGA
jgi:hypothetical protein